MPDLLPLFERSCKAFRAGLGSVAVVVGELFPARRAPYWLESDADDEVGPCPQCKHATAYFPDLCIVCSEPNDVAVAKSQMHLETCGCGCGQQVWKCGPSKSPVASAGAAVEDAPEAGGPPSPASGVLHGVPTFAALQNPLTTYLTEHQILWTPYPECSCGQTVTSRAQYIEHVTELQASALSFAIQEARNTEAERRNFWPDELSGGQS